LIVREREGREDEGTEMSCGCFVKEGAYTEVLVRGEDEEEGEEPFEDGGVDGGCEGVGCCEAEDGRW